MLIQMLVNLIQSVTENETFYTKRQLQRAKIARNLLHALGNPTVEEQLNQQLNQRTKQQTFLQTNQSTIHHGSYQGTFAGLI